MRRVISLLILFLSVASAAQRVATDAEMIHGLRLAREGELVAPELVHALEARYAQSPEGDDGLVCAYLLSFSPRRLLALPREKYIDVVLRSPRSQEAIGAEGLCRLHRMVADEAYDDGKFDVAIEHYHPLLESSNAQWREYAVIKTGWCLLNLKHADRAYRIWLENAKVISSPTLWQSMGLALAENKHRTSNEVEALNALSPSSVLKAQFARGMEEGFDSLGDSEVAQLAEDTRRLSWRPELVAGLFENSHAPGDRACRLLHWLVLPGQTLTWATQGSSVSSCSQWAVSQKKKANAASSIVKLDKIFPQFSLNGSDRMARFDFYAVTQPALACLEGVRWLQNAKPGSATTAPVNRIQKACLDGIDIAGFLSELDSAAGAGFLRNKADPFLFLVVPLLQKPATRDAIFSQLKQKASLYRETLLPQLLAETLHHRGDTVAARALYSVYGESATGQIQGTIWEEIFAEEVRGSKAPDALGKLSRSLPVDSLHPATEAETRLWLSVINQAKEDGTQRAMATPAMEKILRNGSVKAYPALASPILELGSEYDLWDQTWSALRTTGLPPFSRLVSERMKVHMVEAIASGGWAPPANALLTDAESQFLVGLGLGLRTSETKKVAALHPAGANPLVPDLKLVKELDHRREEVLGPRMSRRDRITQVTTWVQFVDRGVKKVEHRKWTNLRLYRVANSVLADFCNEAKGRLGKMGEVSSRKADSKEQWEQFVPMLTARLSECEQRRTL